MKIKGVLRGTLNGAREIPAALAVALSTALVAYLAIYRNCLARDVQIDFYLAGFLAMTSSAVVALWGKYDRRIGKWQWLAQASCGLIYGLVAWLLYRYGPHDWRLMMLCGMSAISVISASLLSLGICRKDGYQHFPLLLTSGAIALVTAGVLMLGESLIFLALHQLFNLLTLPQLNNLLCFWALTNFLAIASIVFLSYALHGEHFEQPKSQRILTGLLGLPLYLILLALLLIYVLRCLVATALPNGEINWLVSVTTVLWLFFRLTLGDSNLSLHKIFCRWGGALLLPLLVLQTVAINIRVSIYGLTPMRYASYLLVLASAIFLVASLISKQALRKWIWLIFIILPPLFAFTPLNIVDVGMNAQQRRLNAFRARRDAGETFTKIEQFSIMGSTDLLKKFCYTNGHWRGTNHRRVGKIISFDEQNIQFQRAFEKEWGFPYLSAYERRRTAKPPYRSERRNLNLPGLQLGETFPLDQYATATGGTIRQDTKGVYLSLGGTNRLDITKSFYAYVQKSTNSHNNSYALMSLPDGRVILLPGSIHGEEGTNNLPQYLYGSTQVLLLTPKKIGSDLHGKELTTPSPQTKE